MKITISTEVEMAYVEEKVAVIREALVASDLPRRGSSMSEWTIALMWVAGDLVSLAPSADQGNILDELQRALVLFTKAGCGREGVS